MTEVLAAEPAEITNISSLTERLICLVVALVLGHVALGMSNKAGLFNKD